MKSRFIDIIPSRCVGCSTCRAVCSAGHAQAGYQSEPRLTVVDSRTVCASMTCHHCEGAPCYKVCPTNSIRRDPDGCIRVDETHCIGCKMCAIACPFGAIHMSGTPRSGVAGIEYLTPIYPPNTDPVLRWDIGVYPVAVKCDLCEYNNYVPRCVEACITDALVLVELDEDDPDYNAKKRRQVQASNIMFENIEQAIPEGIDHLNDHIDARQYIAEQKSANSDYMEGLRELGIDTADIHPSISFNQILENAASERYQSDSVKVIEDEQRARYVRELANTPASERGVQVDTDNVIDQLSVGVNTDDLSAHATSYKRALDLQNAAGDAAGTIKEGIAEEGEPGAFEPAADEGIEPGPKAPEEPKVIHGDQHKYNPGRPEDPAVDKSSPVDSPDDVENDRF
ncbi:MAG: 4Fe-4S dicluster domain-containing protein [Eggerthellaceae bacterium]|nr:4Fe-4S dicluster domain-containing protein [Eggerthellaceae bacterium]